jgi:hypothetical protein
MSNEPLNTVDEAEFRPDTQGRLWLPDAETAATYFKGKGAVAYRYRNFKANKPNELDYEVYHFFDANDNELGSYSSTFRKHYLEIAPAFVCTAPRVWSGAAKEAYGELIQM